MTPSLDDSSAEPYKTSDTPYAAFLHYHGFTPLVTRADPNDYKRKVFVFVYNDEIPSLEQEYRYGDGLVEARRYYRSYKIVTRMLHENQ